ncbi:pentapeptide repeat-containing protein [Tropicimonas marinistellae]|uniref:pentapeptide repeat-containing protein n=1 Tax=Tropicimonas marinistellae TaxID=1739787 RepID=UPI000835754B
MRKPVPLRRAEARRPGTPLPVLIEDDAEDAQINRINDLTRAGRANWFGLMAYLAFMLVTVLGVEDADFFIPSRQTDLPLIGVSIPTTSFFLFAPVLGAALYVYLHLIIRKCTEALTAPPPFVRKTAMDPKGVPLENPVLPWLLNDLVLRLRGDGAAKRRPLDALATLTAILLIWLAGPAVLLITWSWSLPAHAEWMSITILIGAAFCIFAGWTSALRLRRGLACAGRDTPNPEADAAEARGHRQRDIWGRVAFLTLLALTLFKTEISVTIFGGISLLARADLAGVTFAELPPGAVNPDTSRHRYRAEWCARQGLKPDVCGHGNGFGAPKFQAEMRRRWCSWHPMPEGADCEAYFTQLDAEFDAEWQDLRRRTIAALAKPDLSGRDLRDADLRNATMPGIDLRDAQMEGAVLFRAQMEGAVLTRAQMEGADLTGAQMEGAVLTGARFQSANWAWANVRSPAQFADFRGGQDLTQEMLDHVIGNEHTLLPADPPGLHVWTCWAVPPEGFDAMVARAAGIAYDSTGDLGFVTEDDLRAQWLCPSGTEPQPTGTPLGLDEVPPWEQ